MIDWSSTPDIYGQFNVCSGAGWLSHRKDKDQLGAVTNIFGNDF